MTDATNRPFSKKEKLPLTAGTVLFVFTVFLLVAGFCRFSFYVLKNHRSAVSRDTFVQSYVDVQPYSGKANTKTAYVKIADSTIVPLSPAAFFKDEKPAAPEPEKVAAIRPLTVPVPDFRRPPVVRKPESKERKAPEPSFSPEEPEAVAEDSPLTFLISSAEETLNETDESVLKIEPLLSEKNESEKAVEKTVLAAVVSPEQTAVAVPEQAPALQEQPAAGKEKPVVIAEQTLKEPVEKQPSAGTESRERWIDIASLREQIKAENDKKAAANIAFSRSLATAKAEAGASETDGTAKTASAAPTTETSVEKENVETVKTALLPLKESSSSALPEQNQPVATAATQTALAEPAEIKAPAPNPPSTSKAPANPWLVAKVAGKAHNALAVRDNRPAEKAKTEHTKEKKEQQTASAATLILKEPTQQTTGTKEQKPVFYKNGRKKDYTVFEDRESASTETASTEKSLNWLDRKQAAVWTSLSQTDTPTVWNASDKNTGDVRAFRVADEIPAEKEAAPVSGKPVIVVGAEEKAETKKDPVLLPLGAPEAGKINASSVPKGSAVPIASFPGGSPVETPAAQPQQSNGDESFLGRMKSLFNIPASSPSNGDTPTLGDTAPSVAAKTATPAKTIETASTVPVPASVGAQSEKNDVMPAEIRLTFKPDSAEISAQAVKWVKAFGARVKKDIQRAIEVRMSSENFPLQEKRFALIRSTLVGVGVQDAQILPVVSDRTPHTIVLKTLDIPEEGLSSYETSVNGVKEQLYYRRW